MAVLAQATPGSWFWIDLRRSSDGDETGVLEIAVATAGEVIPTGWFRSAVAGGLVEHAESGTSPAALDARLFPRHGPGDAYVALLVAMSQRALDLLRHQTDGREAIPWPSVRDELASLYAALFPDVSRRRRALDEYARWLERTTVQRLAEGSYATSASPAAASTVQRYEELGVQLREEVAEEDVLIELAARLAHTQVVRLRPSAPGVEIQELLTVRSLAAPRTPTEASEIAATGPGMTVFDEAARQLRAVCEAVDQHVPYDSVQLLRRLAPWCGDDTIERIPRWSCLGDDCSPFEVSLATSRSGHEVRFLVEAQADPASPESYWRAGDLLTRHLASELSLDLTWFEQVADLFAPTGGSTGYWAMWHAIDLADVPTVKLYLNPRLGTRGPDEVIQDMLARLGLAAAWSSVSSAIACGGVPSHVSFDLKGSGSRIKIYLRHEHANPRALAEVAQMESAEAARDVVNVCAILCRDDALLNRRAPFTTLYFSSDQQHLTRVALHLPVQSYVPADFQAGDRIRSLLNAFALDTGGYERARDALSQLSQLSSGLHSYVGFQRDDLGPRVTNYFGARLYADRLGWLARAPSTIWPSALHRT